MVLGGVLRDMIFWVDEWVFCGDIGVGSDVVYVIVNLVFLGWVGVW